MEGQSVLNHLPFLLLKRDIFVRTRVLEKKLVVIYESYTKFKCPNIFYQKPILT